MIILYADPLVSPDVFITHADLLSRQLSFAWSPVAPDCSTFNYNILASNCGSCPTTTNHTTVTCTDVPTDGSLCGFAIETVVCESITGNLSDVIYVALYRGHDTYAERSSCAGAIVSAGLLATIIVVCATFFIIAVTVKGRQYYSAKKFVSSRTYENTNFKIDGAPAAATIDTSENIAYGQVQDLVVHSTDS